MLKRCGVRELLVLLIAVALVLSLSVGTSEKQLERVAYKSGSEVAIDTGIQRTAFPTYWDLGIFFGSGALAISAMILPGISGSFLMLALGVYFRLLTAINTLMEGVPKLLNGVFDPLMLTSLLIIGVTAIGCLFGLLAFTRLLNYLLERYRNLTIAFLIGLMVGSLYGLWPFREFAMVDGETSRYDSYSSSTGYKSAYHYRGFSYRLWYNFSLCPFGELNVMVVGLR